MATREKLVGSPLREHGGPGPIRKRSFGVLPGRDPRAEDVLASGVALALDMATGPVKRLAAAGSISPQRASAWRSEGKGSPLFDISLIVYNLTVNGDHPGAVVAQVHTAMMQGLLTMTTDALVRRFWTLTDEEHDAECSENRKLSEFQQTGDLEALERADMGEAMLQLERAAVCRELRRRGVDPRTTRQD